MPLSPDTPHFDTRQPLFIAACEVARVLRDAGHQALFAGGCVRDALLHRALKDIDIATSARPEEVERLFPGQTTAVGKAFGVVVVRRDGFAFEVATFRADGAYTDGRRPDGIRFTDAAEDARRRDFTINGLFYDPVRAEILDHVAGRADLAAGVVRAIGDPAERFQEDRLRLLRAVRFTAVLGFRLDPATAAAVRATAGALVAVSAERIGAECTRMLCEAPRPSTALTLLSELDLLPVILPEIAALQGVAQPPAWHPEGDVWTHTCLMLDAIPAPRDPALAYAVLLHDVGKPPARIQPAEPGEPPRFPNHAAIGAEMARAILSRLRQPNALIETVVAAVARHMMFADVMRMRPATLRRFMGAPAFPLELELHRLDVAQSHGRMQVFQFLEAKQQEFAAEPVLPEPWVKGRDLLALGVAAGPAIGRWIDRAYDAQLEARCADRAALLAWLRTAVAAGEPPTADAGADTLNPWRYRRIFMHGTLQSIGHVEEYFAAHTEDLMVLIVQPRIGRPVVFRRRYHRGVLTSEQPAPISTHLFLHYALWYVHHIRTLWQFCPPHQPTIVLVSHPIGLFGMRLLRLIRPLTFAFWIGDYFPGINRSMRLYERIKRRLHRQVDFAFYLSNAINAIMNGAVLCTPRRRTVMWGVKLCPPAPVPPLEPFSLLFVGLLKPGQGLETLFLFLRDHPDFRLTIIGDCPPDQAAMHRRLMQAYGLEDRIFFPNRFYPDWELREVAHGCHAGIALYDLNPLNCTHYADPGKIKTYAELGLPIVMTRISEIAPMVAQFGSGEVIDTIDQLGPALQRLRTNYPRYLQGLEQFNAHFDYEPYYRAAFAAWEIAQV